MITAAQLRAKALDKVAIQECGGMVQLPPEVVLELARVLELMEAEHESCDPR